MGEEARLSSICESMHCIPQINIALPYSPPSQEIDFICIYLPSQDVRTDSSY